MTWAQRKVLVTGANGFLGSHVADRLVALGATTYGAVRKRSAGNDRVFWVEGDLCEATSVRRLCKEVRPDTVFHLAGQTDAAPNKELVLPTLQNNLLGTVLLLHELLETGCRRIVSTASLEEPDATTNEPVAASPYGASKSAAVAYARLFHKLYASPVVLVRPYMTYGPRQRPSKLVPSLALALLRGHAPMVTQPERQVDWVYIDDVVDGIVSAGSAEGIEGRTFDLGSGALVRIRELAELMEEVVGGDAKVQYSSPRASVGEQGRKANVAPAAGALAWRAATSLRSGLEQTVEWYRARLADYAAAH